jgi:hypothetical protein
LALQTVCWSTAGSQIFGVHHTAAGLPRWCILGCSAISLDSIHWMSVAVTPHTHTFNNQDHLRTLSRVLLAGAKSPSVKNPLLRADGVAQVVDCPPSMQEALSSNSTTAKKKKKKEKPPLHSQQVVKSHTATSREACHSLSRVRGPPQYSWHCLQMQTPAYKSLQLQFAVGCRVGGTQPSKTELCILHEASRGSTV